MNTPTGPVTIERLHALLRAHSTPGDEEEVARILLDAWADCGLRTSRHGRFAVSAAAGDADGNRPTILVCAHMDSPGYIVEEVRDSCLKLLPLGGVRFRQDSTPGILKTSKGRQPATIRRETDETAESFFCERVEAVSFGDRVCFASVPEIGGDETIRAPFLDNRLGCFLLCELAKRLDANGSANWVLGATACEEMGGFGAPILARAVQPDLVLCADATYEADSQEVTIGNGPVLTLSDASTLVSPHDRDRILALADSRGIALQTEVYNTSGTDARAFPHMGIPGPVFALLLASRDNHTPSETASLRDFRMLLELIPAFEEFVRPSRVA